MRSLRLRCHSLVRQPLISFIVIIFAFAISGCAATMHLPSHWNEHKIVVDGQNKEWDITYLIDDNKLVIGFVNDSSFVYLLLATNDRGLAMSMMRSLTVWFDPKGGTDHTFGIRYPLGGMFARGSRSGEGEEADVSTPVERAGSGSTELEILGPGKDDRHRMQILETGGIQASVSHGGNSFVYELRVPFSATYPFSIKSTLGSTIALGLETSQTSMPKREQSDGERREGGEEGGEGGFGGGGMRGGGRGGRGGRGGYGGSGAAEQLDIWMKVPLVAKDTVEQ